MRGYKFAVEWIAMNDEPLDINPETVSGYISTLLIADTFEKTPEKVAADIIKFRKSDEFPFELEHSNV